MSIAEDEQQTQGEQPSEGEMVENGDGSALAVRAVASHDMIQYSPEKVALLKRTVAKDCTNDELELFLHVANRSGLDPFARQVYAIRRYSKKEQQWILSIQTGIDGYRLIAQRTGQHGGTDDAVFECDDHGKPVSATVTVYRVVKGLRCPYTATARWSEYHPGASAGPMWSKMPFNQLAKCAEALAIRKGFSAELSGLYTHDEMEQADSPVPQDVPQANPASPHADSRATRNERGQITTDAIKALMKRYYGLCVGVWGEEKAKAEYVAAFKAYCCGTIGQDLTMADWTWEIHDRIAAAMDADSDPTPPSER